MYNTMLNTVIVCVQHHVSIQFLEIPHRVYKTFVIDAVSELRTENGTFMKKRMYMTKGNSCAV